MKQIFERAIELVQAGWTTGAWCRDNRDWEVWPGDPNACCFCMLGALKHVCTMQAEGSRLRYEALWNQSYEHLNNVAKALVTSGLVSWNDNHATKEAVIKLLTDAKDKL